MNVAPARGVAAHQQTVGAFAAVQQRTDRAHRLGIVDDQGSPHAALGRIVELDGLAAQADVLAQQRRDAERVVLFGVLLTAGPEVAEIEQVQRQRQHSVALQPATGEIRGDASAPPGQRRRHLQHPVELLLAALLLPLLVVEVLAAARRVRADRLNMSVGMGTDPHVLPCRRDHQVVDALQGHRIGDGRAVRVVIREAPAAPHSAQPGSADYAAAQSHADLPSKFRRRCLVPVSNGVWDLHHGDDGFSACGGMVTASSARG